MTWGYIDMKDINLLKFSELKDTINKINTKLKILNQPYGIEAWAFSGCKKN